MVASFEEIAEMKVSTKQKKDYFEKEYSEGTKEVSEGVESLRKSKSQKATVSALNKIRMGKRRKKYAQIQLIKAGAYKRKKMYWK